MEEYNKNLEEFEANKKAANEQILFREAKNVDLSLDGNKESVTIIVPKEKDEFNKFITLNIRKNKKEVKIQEEGIVLTEKSAKQLKVKIGDTVYINREEEEIPVKITGITEQYVMNYAYMTENLYTDIFEEDIQFNEVLVTLIGTLTGLGLGVLLHKFIMTTAEPGNIMFGRNIDGMSFIYSAILTLVFSGIVNFAMYFKLKKTPMVESLKSLD